MGHHIFSKYSTEKVNKNIIFHQKSIFSFFIGTMSENDINSGLYYKNITIVYDMSRVTNEWCDNLKCHLRSSIMWPESSIKLLGLSIKPLENI